MANHHNTTYQIPIARTASPKSKFHKITERPTFRSIALVLLLTVIAFVAYIAQPSNKPTGAHTVNTESSTTKPSSTHSTTSSNTHSQGSGATASTKAEPNSTSSSANANTAGPCNSVLTTDQAKSVLGSNPTASASNGVTSQTTDMTTISCAYIVASDTASIIEHKSSTPAGQHENDDQFGSARPSGVTSVSGYGQVAYWQSSTGLNILQNNNWYIVSVSTNGSISESSSEQLAKVSSL